MSYELRIMSAYLTTKHTKHTKIMNTEYSRTFLCLFAVCGTKKETRLFFVELGGRLSEKKPGFPPALFFVLCIYLYCIFSCVSWLKNRQPGISEARRSQRKTEPPCSLRLCVGYWIAALP